jgi:putative transposase
LIGIYFHLNISLLNIDNLEKKWGNEYSIVIKSWRDKWDNLSRYFQYTTDIRRIIYTTNTVEGYHRQVRKITKTKGAFPNDDSLYKLVYLVYRNIKKKWTMPIANWGQSAQQLAIKFGDRFKIM